MTATQGLAQAQTFATHTVSNLSALTSSFFVLIVLAGILFLFAWYVGRGPFIALLLAFYAACAVYSAFPYLSYLPTAPATTALAAHVLVYLVLVFVFYLIMRRVAVSDFLAIGSIGCIILSLLGAGFLMALAYHLFSVSAVFRFSPALTNLFAPNEYFFWWFAAPAIGLFFLAR